MLRLAAAMPFEEFNGRFTPTTTWLDLGGYTLFQPQHSA
jgi:hypothetical protein